MTKLAQAYVHLRPYEFDPRSAASLGQAADQLAHDIALRRYGRDVDVDVMLEEGSLKARITIIGGLCLGAYGILADYNGFKESITELCTDARSFGTDVCGAFANAAGASSSQIFRTERRLKTPGKLYRVITALEKLDAASNELDPEELRLQVAAIRQQLEVIEQDLSPEDAEALPKLLSYENLPLVTHGPLRHPGRHWLPPIAIRPETGHELILGNAAVPLQICQEPVPEEQTRLIYHNRTAVRPSELSP